MKNDKQTRRTVMTGLGVAAAAAGLRPAVAGAHPQAGGFRPARHELDAWMDRMPGQHRVFIDSATSVGAGEALAYATNLYRANESAYSIEAHDLAMVICFRHWGTPFGYNDAMWAKYGEQFGEVASFVDPRTDAPATANLFDADGYGVELPNRGSTITAQVDRGAHFAVCEAATRYISGVVSRSTGGSADDVFEELTSNAIPHAHFVSAGVVALTRAQEYGYSLLYAG